MNYNSQFKLPYGGDGTYNASSSWRAPMLEMAGVDGACASVGERSGRGSAAASRNMDYIHAGLA